MLARSFTVVALAIAACTLPPDDMGISSSGYPGFNVFGYTHCGVAVRGNGDHPLPWTGKPAEVARTRAAAFVAQLGALPMAPTIELGHACYMRDLKTPVLHLVLDNWNEVDAILRAVGHWLIANDSAGEIDVVVANGATPPRSMNASQPLEPRGPCVASASTAGYTVYRCPQCGTAVVGTGSAEFTWRRPAPKSYDSAEFDRARNESRAGVHGVSSLHASGLGHGCFSRRLGLAMYVSSDKDISGLAEQLGEQLANASSGEEIDVVLAPLPHDL